MKLKVPQGYSTKAPSAPGSYWLASIPEGIELPGEMRFDGRWITMVTGMEADFTSEQIAEAFWFGPRIYRPSEGHG